MTTSMAISKCFRFTKNIPLRSFIQFHLNPIATADSIPNASESQSKLRPYETPSPNLLLRNDVAAAVRNQVDLAALSRGETAPLLARGRAVKIEEEFNEEDGEDVDDDSDEFEDEDEDDEMDGEDCDDDYEDDEVEYPVFKKRK